MQLWLLYSTAESQILTHLQIAATSECVFEIHPTPSVHQPLYSALRSFHLLSPAGRSDNRLDPGKKTVPINGESQTPPLLDKKLRAS